MVDLKDVDVLIEIADENLEYLNSSVGTYPADSSLNIKLTEKRDQLQRARDWLSNMLATERAPKAKK